MRPVLCLGFLSSFVLGACASSGPAAAQQQQSSDSIRAAEEVGATHVPQAALHLQLAKEEFEASKHEKDDKERATLLLQRAQVDAELALALARSETERSQAQGAIDQLNQFNQAAVTQ